MKNIKLFSLFVGIGMFVFCPCFAQYGNSQEGVRSFQQGSNAWRRQTQQERESNANRNRVENDEPIRVLPVFQKELGGVALNNILQAENLFCYHVGNVSSSYNGYTINGMALLGFCGNFGPEVRNVLTRQFFGNANNIDTTSVAQCVMQPKIMLRYVRGVDFTDVLISSPCQSIAVFYGGKVMTYNFSPVARLIDEIVNIFSSQRVDFVSPALLNQLAPIGAVLNAEQQQLLGQRRNSRSAVSKSNNSNNGWNKLKKNTN